MKLFVNAKLSLKSVCVHGVVMVVCLFAFYRSIAQDSLSVKSGPVGDFIQVVSRAHQDSVVLRWAPSGPAAWKLLNRYGYKIERYVIGRDGKVLDQKPMTILAPLVKPAPQAQWEPWLERDDMTAIAAQSIFGEDFQINMNQGDVMQIYNKVRELESRYSFGLFAADLSAKAAQLSGLRWVDKNVKSNEMYVYRVYSLVPESLAPIKFGFTYTGPSEARPLPLPRAPELQKATETSVLIKWETYGLRDIYIAYILERSSDNGKSFVRLNKTPMTILQSSATDDGTAYSTQSDTLIAGVKFLYRVRGMNSFGEVGPPSEILDFTGIKPFTSNASITGKEVINNALIKLRWEFPQEALSEVKSFEVERSDKPHDNFKVINKDIIDPYKNEYVDEKPLATNYYRIAAISVHGQRTISFPYLVQLEDSIPPVPPTDLRGVIDSTGVVRLTWKNNKESDLLGYRIYRSSFKNSEFSQISRSAIEDSVFVDTVNIKTLSNKMYYKIVAVDNRFNPSDFSKTLKLILPDVLPPVPPSIQDIRSLNEGVELRWINSSSEDVVQHQILRRHQYSNSWSIIAKVNIKDTSRYYFDKTDSRHRYQYAMISVDSAGLKSTMTKPLWAAAVVTARPKIEDIQVLVDRERKLVNLSWSYSETDIEKFLIYRATEGMSLSLYKSIKAPATKFADQSLSLNTTYSYRVKAVFKDGAESYFSDEVKIKY